MVRELEANLVNSSSAILTAEWVNGMLCDNRNDNRTGKNSISVRAKNLFIFVFYARVTLTIRQSTLIFKANTAHLIISTIVDDQHDFIFNSQHFQSEGTAPCSQLSALGYLSLFRSISFGNHIESKKKDG